MEHEFTFDTILADTDVYMWNLKMTHLRNPENCLANKVYYVYQYYRRINSGALNYSNDNHINFWKLIQNNPSVEELATWMAKHTNEWHTTKYGLTNGRLDWYSGGCFGENTKIRMADQTLKEIQYIQKDDLVWNPITEKSCKVICMVKWKQPVDCVKVPYSDLYITPYHPILNDTQHWIYPIRLFSEDTTIEYTQKYIYNMVLESGHIIEADTVYTCTLGHQFTSNNVVKHAFFGTEKVIESLQKINPEDWNNGCVTVSCAVRDADTGLVVDFI